MQTHQYYNPREVLMQPPHLNTMPSPQPNSTHYGFKARMFPLLGCLIGLGSILWTYYVAVSKSPPDVKPFPWTDITHTAIHFPEYIIFRIGMLVCPVLLAISFQILKNYLQIKSFEITGHADPRVNQFGPLAIFACILLCVSTATISDGGDMNWTAHTIGATGFFIISLYIVVVASRIYRDLYVINPFVAEWSYFIKKYTNVAIAVFLGLTALQGLEVIDWGSFVEWAAAFFLMGYFFTLYYDFAQMEILMVRQ